MKIRKGQINSDRSALYYIYRDAQDIPVWEEYDSAQHGKGCADDDVHANSEMISALARYRRVNPEELGLKVPGQPVVTDGLVPYRNLRNGRCSRGGVSDNPGPLLYFLSGFHDCMEVEFCLP